MIDILRISPVIPVVTVRDLAHAVPLARALRDGGIGIIELTLRTPVAVEAIRRISREVPDLLVGAGTVLSPHHVEDAVEAGAGFLVSPGAPVALHRLMRQTGLPVLPGVATLTEVMTALDEGARQLKFFPADAAGGPDYLAAITAPVPDAEFCPTGGVTVTNASSYLGLPNVACVGGSWLTPASAVTAQDWTGISRIARESLAALAVPS